VARRKPRGRKRTLRHGTAPDDRQGKGPIEDTGLPDRRLGVVARSPPKLSQMDLGPAWRFKILSYGLWERRFDRDPSVIGRSINLDGRSVAVTGVLPRGLRLAWSLHFGLTPPGNCICRHERSRRTGLAGKRASARYVRTPRVDRAVPSGSCHSQSIAGIPQTANTGQALERKDLPICSRTFWISGLNRWKRLPCLPTVWAAWFARNVRIVLPGRSQATRLPD
jgi:hypothetical protein